MGRLLSIKKPGREFLQFLYTVCDNEDYFDKDESDRHQISRDRLVQMSVEVPKSKMIIERLTDLNFFHRIYDPNGKSILSFEIAKLEGLLDSFKILDSGTEIL